MTQFADTNRVRLTFVEETTWGVTPTGPNMTKIPYTGESLKGSINTVTSNTIRDDRNIPNMTVTGGGASGDFSFEMSYTDYDEFLKGLLQSSFLVTSAVGSSMTFEASGTIATTSATNFTNLNVGQFIQIVSATTAGNNGIYRITAAASTSVQVADISTGNGASFTAELFGTTTALRGKMIRNGVTNRSYSIEKYFSDIGEYFVYAGMRVGGMALNFEANNILTGSFSFVGKSQAGSSTTAASAVTESSGNDVMDASNNVSRVWFGSEAVSTSYIKSMAINIDNAPREQTAVGESALIGVGTGSFNVSGSLTAYFDNRTLADEFINGTASFVRFQVTDQNSNNMILTIPRLRWSDATIVAGGGNDDVMVSLNYQGFIDSGQTHTLQLDML